MFALVLKRPACTDSVAAVQSFSKVAGQVRCLYEIARPVASLSGHQLVAVVAGAEEVDRYYNVPCVFCSAQIFLYVLCWLLWLGWDWRQKHFASDGQSVGMSWCGAPVTVLSCSGAFSDERSRLSLDWLTLRVFVFYTLQISRRRFNSRCRGWAQRWLASRQIATRPANEVKLDCGKFPYVLLLKFSSFFVIFITLLLTFVAPETLLYLAYVPAVKIVPLLDALQQLMLFAMP
jgi:hypothetical protein